MKYEDMTCETCFHGGGAFDDGVDYTPVCGRTEEGEESYSDRLYAASVVCKLEPNYKLISTHPWENGAVPEIAFDPSQHRCGQGLWSEDGKILRLWEGELD
jgi:hypothetical protein